MKKIGSLMLVTGILANLSLGTVTTIAADGGEYDSKGVITFTPNVDPIDPVDPTDPTGPIKPIDPTDPNGEPNPGTAGPLSIDYVSSLDFGSQKITSKDKVYLAKAQKYLDKDKQEKTGPNFVQVTDNRGSEAGWTLQVKQNGQFKTADNEELVGAEVVFKNGQVVTTSDSDKPTGQTTITTETDGTLHNVMMAKAGQGAGTYLHNWGDTETAAKSIELSVPGATTKYAKEYSTTFTWVLTDAPGN
ncbi:WxL domain-containing protein [Enterococcus hermanniensis]|uniref:Cell surface protein n=1 Tax=Enterococcus hermanniensis TaxID=249189 RepID=A0A1L8TPQ4_9ENTE|nr:WxL domain-containing protein [Enterococcus hermanniensis]OJG46296.1 cell surface protein [Enterococcus hermanniensis]